MTTERIQFEADEMFAVDAAKRTVTGLVLPYGAPSSPKGGRRFMFGKGSLRFSDISRVKLLRDHDSSKPLGVAVKATETDQGMVATFKVARGAAGDEVLALAEDGVLDGFSVGVDFNASDVVLGEDDTVQVLRAAWRETSLTAVPSFDDARVTSVKASSETRSVTTNLESAMQQSDATPATAPDLSAITAAITAGFASLSAPEPQPITATFSTVTEAPVYRFNGERAEHEFSTDVFSASKGDIDARTRLDRFMAETFAVTKSNASAVNPLREIPGMFVDRLANATPVTDAIYKGTLADGTPFRWPGFSASSGLVGDHTEGTEPTAGSYSTSSSSTVTPSALSGKIDINREVVDQGGNPQVSSLIWSEILRQYASAIETKAVAVLSGLSLSGANAVTITTGATGATLANLVEAAIVAKHFATGGMREDTLLLQQDLFTALMSARDSAGRALYPTLNPVNADGTSAPNFGSLAIGPLVGRPAWSLGATSSASSNSYLFASADVFLWASAPKRFDFEYRVADVQIGVFGYVATATTRTSHVTRLAYDPVV